MSHAYWNAGQFVPGGVRPTDHWHRKTNDGTCSRCRALVPEDEVPLMMWSPDGQDMLIFCESCDQGDSARLRHR